MIEAIVPGSQWKHTTMGYISEVDELIGVRSVQYHRMDGGAPFSLSVDQFLLAYHPWFPRMVRAQ